MKKDLPNRKPTRHKDFDYGSEGYYFVTICSEEKKDLFGKIKNGEMILNSIGKIIDKCWRVIPDHFTNIELDHYQIMPNHLHGIIIINSVGEGFPFPNINPNNNSGNGLSVPNYAGDGRPVPYNKKISLSDVVGYFKY